MLKKAYFDTNVIVDLFDEGRINHKYSVHVLKTILKTPLLIYLPHKS